MIDKKLISKYWEDNREQFEKTVSDVDAVKHGVFLTEGLLLCSVFDILGTDLIIESGTAYGTSAEIFANYFDIPVITIDSDHLYSAYSDTANKLASYSNLTCLKGDSFNLLPELIRNNSDKRISVFIDGPKGDGAIQLRNKIINYGNIVSVGFHDIDYPLFHRIKNKDIWPVFNSQDLLHSYELDYLFEEYSYLAIKNKEFIEERDKHLDEPRLWSFPNGVGTMIEKKSVLETWNV